MTGTKKYGEYKDSGIEWVGPIPVGWDTLPLFAVVQENTASNKAGIESNLLSLSYGQIVRKDIAANDGLLPASFDTYQVISRNDIVLRLTDLQNDKRSLRSAISPERGIITSAYLALTPTRILPNFLSYLLRAYDLQKVFYSMGGGLRQSMKFSDMKSLPLVVPPAPLQESITAYLDRETAQIDDLIGKQERLIELLAEKRQAIITHAVTKGLDPSAPTKPSGIPWLGDIPAAWKVSKLSWETRGIGDGLHGTPTYSDQGSIPFVNGTNLLGGEIRITDSTNFVEEDQLSRADLGLDESTVLISINGTIGNCAVLGNRQVMLSKSAAYIKCSESLDVHFLAHYLRSHPTRSYFFATSGGTTIANLSLAALRGTPIPVPPLPMQEEITKWLNEQIQSFDELGSKAYEAARLLRERRSALISAAVTGKIDVREGVVTP